MLMAVSRFLRTDSIPVLEPGISLGSAIRRPWSGDREHRIRDNQWNPDCDIPLFAFRTWACPTPPGHSVLGRRLAQRPVEDPRRRHRVGKNPVARPRTAWPGQTSWAT